MEVAIATTKACNMIDQRFYNKRAPQKLAKLVELIDGAVYQDGAKDNDIIINDIKPLNEANKGDLSFLSNKKYIDEFKKTKASACLVPETFSTVTEHEVILVKTKNPYRQYAKLIELFYDQAKPYANKIMPSAYVAKSAAIGNNCYIGHNVVIEENCVIGDDSIIEAGVFIDYGVVIGKRARIYSNVSISYSIIGDDVVILPGAKIGQDGFGFATESGVHHKIFHTGIVKIGNNVEIGANTTIDRGSIQPTVIEDLCRIDNLVQIGHNVTIGRGSIIVAQVGIAGSSKIGKYCSLGGQVGIAGHITVADKVQVAAQGGVIQDIEPGAIIGGTPAVPIKDWLRQSIIINKMIKKEKMNEY